MQIAVVTLRSWEYSRLAKVVEDYLPSTKLVPVTTWVGKRPSVKGYVLARHNDVGGGGVDVEGFLSLRAVAEAVRGRLLEVARESA